MSIYYCHACERQHDGDYIEQADTEPTMCAEYGPEAAADDMTEQMLQWRDAAKWSENQHQHWKHLAEVATAQRDEARRLHMVVRNELDTLRARLAACERVVEAASRVIDADTDVLQAVAIVMLREAFAAETCARSAPITVGDTQGETDA